MTFYYALQNIGEAVSIGDDVEYDVTFRFYFDVANALINSTDELQSFLTQQAK